jgi:lysophospholipase L1-like esterase
MRFTLCCLLLLSSSVRAADQPVPDEFAAAALKPFWRATRLSESMFFIQSQAGVRPQSSLLFKPTRIISITSATRQTVYEAGRDYILDETTATLCLPEGSRIPFKTADELTPLMASDSPKIGRMSGDKSRGVYFDNADGYHKLQVEVTYTCEPDQWKGAVPAFAGEQLPGTLKKLRAGEPVSLMLCGDSISAGFNATKFTKALPGCPAYGELVALGLEKHFGSKVTFENHAVNGWGSGQGLKDAADRRIGRKKPDLVIIAFGMNDVFGKDAAGFQKNIRGLMEVIRNDSPGTEFVLVAPMLGNKEWGMPMEQFPLYRDALKELSGKGAALVDMTTLWGDLLKRKSFYDLTGNGVNHPNDFGHQVYAQAVAALLVEGVKEQGHGVEPIPIFGRDARVLFQGDSITDGNRGRSADPNHILGHGYVFIIAARHGAAFPELNITFINRGVSGNKVIDLEKRWQKETIDLKPDVLSILIGINDNASVPLDQYERVYDQLLTDARAANPKLKLVLGEPFLIPATTGQAKDEKDDAAMATLRQRQAIVAKLARKHEAALVRYQAMFEAACRRAPAKYWVWDAVHPTTSGHQLMADLWEETVRARWPEK